MSAPEPIPARLYWYARQADRQGRAAQFLGFYQVLEYFFPRYSIAKEVTRLRKELSSAPAGIDGGSDATLRLLLSEIYGRRGVGKEEQQLGELLNMVVSKDDLRSFLDGDPVLREFYRKAPMPFVSEGISLENPRADLRNESASRLYQIRM